MKVDSMALCALAPRFDSRLMQLRLFMWLLLCCLQGCSGCDMRLDGVPSDSQPEQTNEYAAPESPDPAGADSAEPAQHSGRRSSDAPAAVSPDVASATNSTETNDVSRSTTEKVDPQPLPGEASSEPARARPGDAAQAHAEAQKQYRQAQRSKAAGKPGAAFQEMAAAWQMTQAFPNNPDCRDLGKTIYAEFRQLAREANAKATGPSGTLSPEKTLVDQ